MGKLKGFLTIFSQLFIIGLLMSCSTPDPGLSLVEETDDEDIDEDLLEFTDFE